MKQKEMLSFLTVNQRVAGSSPAGGASRGIFHGFFLVIFSRPFT